MQQATPFRKCLVVVWAVLAPVTHEALIPTAFYYSCVDIVLQARNMHSESSSDLPTVTGTSINVKLPERSVAPGELAGAGRDHR